MIRRITVDQVIEIHDRLVCAAPIRDFNTLDGVVAAPFQGFAGHDFYPGVVPKAAKYLEGLSTKQAFVDGNKRTAWITTHSFLRFNGLSLLPIDDLEVDNVLRQLIVRELTFEELSIWLNDRVALQSL